MCGPVAMGVMAALSTAGTAASAVSQHEQTSAEQDAANQAMRQEALRQEQLDQQKQHAYNQVLQQTAGADNTNQAMADAQQQRQAAIQDNVTALSHDQGHYNPAATGGGMHVVQNAYKQRQTQDAQQTAARGQALASLSSLGDALQNLHNTRQPYLDSITAANDMARGSASLLPEEINTGVRNASSTGALLGAMGTLGTTLGNAGLGYYAGKGGNSVPSYNAGRTWSTVNTRIT